jgi:hypothetical protein
MVKYTNYSEYSIKSTLKRKAPIEEGQSIKNNDAQELRYGSEYIKELQCFVELTPL